MEVNLAPLILFLYNRPGHTAKTLAAIANMSQIEQTDLYIFADGPKEDATENTRREISTVREQARNFSASKSIRVILAKENKGLAKSVIEGIDQVFKMHESVIVLEDDLTPGKHFLVFMNNALSAYQTENEVMQVSGYDFPVKKGDFSREPYFSSLTTTWGWGTWKRAWEQIDFTCPGFSALKTDQELAKRFDVNNGYAYSKMLLQQMEGKRGISSWGIRFYWNVFNANGKILYPGYPLVLNEGWDGSGTHGDSYELFPINDWDVNYIPMRFPLEIVENQEYQESLSMYLASRISLKQKAFAKIKATYIKIKKIIHEKFS